MSLGLKPKEWDELIIKSILVLLGVFLVCGCLTGWGVWIKWVIGKLF